MVRELLLSSTSSLCDECMLCEHVKHHIPEQLFVPSPAPPPHKAEWERTKQTEKAAQKPIELGENILHAQSQRVSELGKSKPWNTLLKYIFIFGLYQCVVIWFWSDWQFRQWTQLEMYMPLQIPVTEVNKASPQCSKLKTGGGLLCQCCATSTLFPPLSSPSSALFSSVEWLKQLAFKGLLCNERMHSKPYKLIVAQIGFACVVNLEQEKVDVTPPSHISRHI